MPKSSIEMPTPSSLRRADHVVRPGRVGDDRALGDLDASGARRAAPISRAARDVARAASRSCRLRIERLTATSSAVPLALPARDLAERLVEHVARERLDQAGLLGGRHELAGHDQAARRGAASSSAPRCPRARRCARRAWAGSAARARGCAARAAAPRAASGSPCRGGRARRRRSAWVAPVSLATYIATSARLSSVSTSPPCSG